MSFEVYLQFFDNSEEAGVDSVSVREAFVPYSTMDKPDVLSICYDDRNSCDVFLDYLQDTSLVSGLTISRPCQDNRLWDSLIAIMRQGNAILYFPGGEHPLVASPSAIPHLPTDMVEALGNPFVVENAGELLAAMRES
ncbi:MAG TPA: hypothetical protein VGK34_03820 [Armatimonadota bacterium]|jgi:hypothetical protein